MMSIPLTFMLCTFSSCVFLPEPSSTTQINFTDEIERCMWFRNGTTNIFTATAGDEGTCRCRTFQALVDLNWRDKSLPFSRYGASTLNFSIEKYYYRLYKNLNSLRLFSVSFVGKYVQ